MPYASRSAILFRVYLTILACIVAGNAKAQPTFMGLGTFGGLHSEAHDVSADGTVVVGVVSGPPGINSGIFRWTSDGSVVYREAVSITKLAVSDDGTTVVGSRFLRSTGLSEAFRWIPNGGLFEGLGDLPGAPFDSKAYDVSADGRVIVGSGDNYRRAFRWTQQGGMIDIGQGEARGVSSDGNVIAGSQGRWTAETGWVQVTPVPKGSPEPYGISPDGTIVVGALTYPYAPGYYTWEPFRWTEQDGAISLSPPQILAVDVSADGSAVVGSGLGRSTGATAFYWSPQTGMVEVQDLLVSLGVKNLDNWELQGASGVSHDGKTIVGEGLHNGHAEAWLAIIPEPSTIVLFGIGAAALLGFARLCRIQNARARTVKESSGLRRPLRLRDWPTNTT